MKLAADPLKVSSTMTGETVQMGIAVEDMAHIMGVMTNLYENRLLAVIREYSTNAWDAHIEAGVSLPIEITLPNDLAPVFKVRDYGFGLDADDIRTIYSQYGRSTKRGTNDQVGMLGLGCKSALTYADQFTVSSVKDGVRTAVLISRQPNGGGIMQILGQTETDEAAGTEVSVAIRSNDLRRCREEAESLFSYWPDGSVLINGETPPTFIEHHKAFEVTPSTFIIPDQHESRVVMGGVPYRTDKVIDPNYRYRYSVVAFAPIGSVEPTPSRESLKDTPLTNETTARLRKELKDNLDGAVQRSINKAANHREALDILIRWGNIVGQKTFPALKYKGSDVLQSFSLPRVPKPDGHVGYWDSERNIGLTRAQIQGRGMSSINWTGVVYAATLPKVVWVYNFDKDKITPAHKRKMQKWLTDSGLTGIDQFGLIDAPNPANEWIPADRCVDWETIRKIKLPIERTYRSGSSGRLAGSYDIWTENGLETEVPADDIRLNVPLFHEENSTDYMSYTADRIKELFPQFTLVGLRANRVDKWNRLFPQSRNPHKAIQEEVEKLEKQLTPEDRKYCAVQAWGNLSQIKQLDPTKVDDPALKEAIKLVGMLRPPLVAKLARHSRLEKYALDDMPDPMYDYPLALVGMDRFSSRIDMEHIYLYMNALYAARKDPSVSISD